MTGRYESYTVMAGSGQWLAWSWLGWRKGVWSVTLTFAKGDDVDRGRHRSICKAAMC